MQDYIKEKQDMPSGLVVGAYILFGSLLFFCIVAFLANLCIAWKNKVNCRACAYLGVGGLFILGLLAFGLTLTSTIAVPNGFFMCDFASSSASNS